MFLTIILSLVYSGLLVSAEDKSQQKIVISDYKKYLSGDCINSYSATCLKLNVLSWVDKLNEEDDYSVLPGISVVRENGSSEVSNADVVATLARYFPNDPDSRLDAFLIKKVTSYFNNHSLRLNLLHKNSEESGRGRGGGGGGGNKGGGMGNMGGMVLAAGAMMKGTLIALALGGIAAVAGKAIMTGLISLLLSAIIGLKALTQGHKSTTYEIVSKPIYTHSNTHSVSHEDHGHGFGGYGHSSYGRSFSMPLPLDLQPNYKSENK